MADIYYEYVIKGDEDKLCAYLQGFLRGKGIVDGYYFSKNHPFHRHRLKEFIKYHGEVGHLICAKKLRNEIQSAIRQSASSFGFEVKDIQKISTFSFRFKFETFNRKAASAIKHALGEFPPGVHLSNYDPEDVSLPKARGPEAYAPLHEYTFRGEGLIEGDIAGLLKLHQILDENEFVDCDHIEIHH